MKRLVVLAIAGFFVAAVPGQARELIRLANNPNLSPDGATLAFDWNGDVWSVPTTGGVARPLTQHPARDREPKFSPDGKEIAFTSDRDGASQVYVMAAQGGTPRRLTYHSEGFSLQGWFPDGQNLLVQASRDHFWRHPERFFHIPAMTRGTEQPLFDDYGHSGDLSPDGKRLLFVREAPAWWRKGYHGSQAGQIWLYDLDKRAFSRVLENERGCLWPLWKPDGKSFYYVGGAGGTFNLREHDLEGGSDRQLTHFPDDSVVFPCLSRDGSTIVFRHLFDLYRFRPTDGGEPKKIEIWNDADRQAELRQRRVLQTATEVAFTQDGLEIAFVAGGDLWVMDTELREPRQVTATPEEESDPVFAPIGQALLFVSGKGGKSEVWKAQPADAKAYWWQNHSFTLTQLTQDGEAKSALAWGPDGKHIAYVRGRGDLWVAGADGKDAKCVLHSWNAPQYDWSPDGKWLVYAVEDNDFNRDVWLIPADGSGKPYNLSRHPYNESHPVWSPDGKLIAFAGQRAAGGEGALCYVWLRAEDDEKGTRDRAIEKALEKINKVRKPGGAKKDEGADKEDKDKEKKPADVVIDFDRLTERVHRVALPEGEAGNLAWSPDSTRLAFTATVEGKPGLYTLDVTDDPKPKLLSAQTGTHTRWLKQGNQLVWLSGGVPGSLPMGAAGSAGGRSTPPATPPATPPPARGSDSGAAGATGTAYRFQALQEVDVPKRHGAAFDLCWRAMRDHYYDERLGKRDWEAIRAKYHDMAEQAPDGEAFATVVSLMLGELNGSHLGFRPNDGGAAGRRGGPRGAESPAATDWQEQTAHLGLRYDLDFKGPGLKVKDVLPRGPADQRKSKIAADEVVLSIDGTPVDTATDLTTVLNGPPARDILLKVRGADRTEREVVVRPISFTLARSFLREKWLEDNRKMVEESSGGTLGYLHISAMDMPSFHKFEEELYSVGSGKDGLVIDVRENGGGSTTDHLLTALTQPVHAITVARGGGQGYPQDRKVYATWNKPIVVLCNQNSFSNAEIFSHAIQTLKRGHLVGVPTAGGVISTGALPIMDLGVLRMPTRGWYLVDDGQDMELNGAVPDQVLWPKPGQLPAGKDVQLEKAVDVLQADVKAWKERPRPGLKKATER